MPLAQPLLPIVCAVAVLVIGGLTAPLWVRGLTALAKGWLSQTKDGGKAIDNLSDQIGKKEN